MSDFATEITPINIEDELKESYLDYAMSVIVGRALPDVRDGLKPVHRRVLFAMNVLNNDYNKPYKKSARVVGDVIGKYHPHGDNAVYDAIVRMAQDFSLRYPLVDGQGNFGSVDGDNAAAMRYTEVRMEKIAHELIADIDKETVDFVPNYDGSEMMPSVMPAKIPNLLVNGSSGIAVGMATNIPPHNLKEVIDGCLAFIDDNDITIEGLMEYIKGPDFPTYGLINGRSGIVSAYQTGRGRVFMRARASVEANETNGKETIIVHEIPYQVNKSKLVESIALLVRDKKVEGITEIRDESDKDGMRIVIELRRGESGEVVLNNLYSLTQMQTTFGVNMVALDGGQPKLMNLKDILAAFVRHRREVVTRRTVYDLRKAREKGHILEGLAVALENIDEIIALIKSSATGAIAKERLLAKGWASKTVLDMLERAGSHDAARPIDLDEQYGFNNALYHLSPVQAQAILDMRLQKLTGLEQDKLIGDYQEVLDKIKALIEILSDPDLLMQIIRDELVAIREEYGDERRTEILNSHVDLLSEDLIPDEEVVVTLSHEGYAKSQVLESYQAQRRGGKGRSSGKMKDEDFVEQLVVASMHDTLLFFTTKGKVYWKRVFELPQGSRASKGRPIVNMLPLDDGEKVSTLLSIKKGSEHEGYLFFATEQAVVKKVPVEQFSRPRTSGLIALTLRDDDCLMDVTFTKGEQNIMLFSSAGKAIRFNEEDVRAMGRTAAGVRGMKLSEGQSLVSLKVVEDDEIILTASENGYGKRTMVEEFKVQSRGGQGVIAMACSERNGGMIGAVKVTDEQDIMMISNAGTLVRTSSSEVSMSGRNTQGVRLIRLNDEESLVTLAAIADSGDDAELGDEAKLGETELGDAEQSNAEKGNESGEVPDSD